MPGCTSYPLGPHCIHFAFPRILGGTNRNNWRNDALACVGDEHAFTEIVRRRHARVRKFMYHVCRDHALGDDLAQQVFLTTWQSLRQLRTAAAFDGWLKRIMVTTWLEELRRRKLPYAGACEEK